MQLLGFEPGGVRSRWWWSWQHYENVSDVN